MNQMSEQMEIQQQMKTAHRVLFQWHRRFKSRQQRRNRLGIADGYYALRLMSRAFSEWIDFKEAMINQHAISLHQNPMAVLACQIMSQAVESSDGGDNIEAFNQLLVRKAYN